VNEHSEHRQDLELARRALQGERDAWRRLYEESCQPLFNLLCYQTGDRETAKDLLQETYLTALRHLDSYRGDGPLLGWLRVIALRKSLDWRRGWARKLRRLSPLTESGAVAPAAPEPRLAGETAAIQAALDGLPPRQRAVLLLRELEELSFREIADTLGCREPTARVHYHRAREQMRRRLGEGGAGSLADEPGGLRP
jgi:RNA polymerase sigma factor (sigma-70 family)